jgi:hypothetical protein
MKNPPEPPISPSTAPVQESKPEVLSWDGSYLKSPSEPYKATADNVDGRFEDSFREIFCGGG